MKLRPFLLVLLPLTLLISCESENWNLVDPPAGRDSVMVRYLNFCGDGAARTLFLDGTQSTELTPDISVSSTLNATSDSAFVSVRGSGTEVLSVASRLHFSKQSNEVLISVPSEPQYARKKALDTILHYSTTRSLLTLSGYSALRMIVCADDSLGISYEMRVGCPNGSLLGSPTSPRQSTAYNSVPSGTFVISLLRNLQPVGVYNLDLREGYYYSLVVGTVNGKSIVRLLDEFNTTTSALTSPPIVDPAQRQAFVRCLNASRTVVDSVVSSSGTVLSSKLAATTVGSYTKVVTCASDLSDTFQSYAGGQAHQSVSTSLGVLAKYTLVCFDSASSDAAAMVLIPPTLTPTPKDSVTVRVVNTIRSSRKIHVRLGARTDVDGVLRNGEVIAAPTAAGTVSKALRVKAGFAPITVFSDSANDPEMLIGCFISNLVPGNEYLFIVGKSATQSVEVFQVDATQENTEIVSLRQGVFTQVINARSDRLTSSCSLTGVYRSANLNFGAALSTVAPQGSATLNATYISKNLDLDTMRRLTLVLSGDASAPDAVVLDTLSMQPQLKVAKSRYLNVTRDQPNILLGVADSSEDYKPLFYQRYQENLLKNQVSAIRAETNPHRVNFVCANSSTSQVFYAPGYPLTFGTGKAYTLVICGSASAGYALVVQQEY